MRRLAALALVAVAACANDRGPDATPLPIPQQTDDPQPSGEVAALERLGDASGPRCPRGITPDVSRFTWLDGADMPTPRTEVAGAALAGRVYVAGGFTEGGEASDVVEAYDPHEDAWEEAPALPEPVHHAGLTEAGGRLWLVGGYTADGSPTPDVWSWAPPDGSWTRGPSLRTARGALAVVSAHDHLVAVGGATGFQGGSLSRATEMLAPGAIRWRPLASLPAGRDHLAAVGESGQAVVSGSEARPQRVGDVLALGGRRLSLESNVTRVDVLHLYFGDADQEWERSPALPRSRGGFAAAGHDVGVYVFGGEEPGGTIAPLDYYEREDAVWCRGPDLPTPRHGLAAVTLGDRIYVVGGGPEPGLTVSGANEILCFGRCR